VPYSRAQVMLQFEAGVLVRYLRAQVLFFSWAEEASALFSRARAFLIFSQGVLVPHSRAQVLFYLAGSVCLPCARRAP
jgi:hypothetical protein